MIMKLFSSLFSLKKFKQHYSHDFSTRKYGGKRAEDNHKPIVLNEEGSRILITTKHLLTFLSNGRPLHIDTTYKFITQRAVSVFGTTDFGGHFTPVGLAITIKEEVVDYEFVFRNIVTFHYKPEKLVSIESPPIQMAAQIVFGNTTVIWTCTSFVRKSIYDRITKDTNINLKDRQEMIAEFEIVNRAASDHSFKDAIDKFIFKWNKYRDFVEYFERKWVIENPNWRKGTSNNGLQSLYRSMKGLDSVQKLERCVQNWSILSNFS